MKNIVIVVISLISINVFSQTPVFTEPEYAGDIVLIKDDKTVELEKQKVYEKTRQHFGTAMVLVGRDEVTTDKIISGGASPIRISQGQNVQFIVKVKDNSISPFDVIDILKLNSTEKNRTLQVGRLGISFSSTEGKVYRIKFNGRKYGNSSYLITIPTILQGEYAITVGSDTYNLFGVDYYYKVGDSVEWIQTNVRVLANENKFTIKNGVVSEIGKNKIIVEENGKTKTIKTLNTIKDEVRLKNDI